jgi:hypothetical protein
MSGVAEDFASVSIELPFSEKEIFSLLCEVELLFRINPHLEIKSWKEEGKGKIYADKIINIDCLNEMNGLRQQMNLCVNDLQPGKSFSLKYDEGLKQATQFFVETIDHGRGRLTVKEIYHAEISVAEKEARLNEVDKSLVPWGEAIHNYVMRRRRWDWIPFYAWLQDVFWLGMSPRHRRITRMIIWTTVLEFVVFMFVFAIYWIELSRGQ